MYLETKKKTTFKNALSLNSIYTDTKDKIENDIQHTT